MHRSSREHGTPVLFRNIAYRRKIIANAPQAELRERDQVDRILSQQNQEHSPQQHRPIANQIWRKSPDSMEELRELPASVE